MRKVIYAAALSVAVLDQAPLSATTDREPAAEVWVSPSMFQQSLAPLAALSGRVARENLCPEIVIGEDRVVHRYQMEAKFRSRGVENQRWEITDIRLLNPSRCPTLDREVTAHLRTAIAEFAQPRKDTDKNGWFLIPGIELRLVD